MAGFRDFQTGEVLTAANVNDFLSKQSVMKFADAAARNTALGTAVGGSNALREGMVAYLDDTDEVQYFDGSVWGAVGSDPNAGIGSNVVQTVKTDAFTTTSTSLTNITGLSVSITPTSASSLVLVILSLGNVDISVINTVYGDVTRDGTPVGVGASVGSRAQAGWGHLQNADRGSSVVWHYLDSPATTSSTTYQARVRVPGSTTGQINAAGADNNDSNYFRTISTITAIEVAA